MKKTLSEDALAYFREQGARGGTIGSKGMTAAQRKARATKASHAAARARTKQKAAKKANG